MEYVLVVLFSLGEGEPTFLNGYLPLFFETEVQCNTAKNFFVENYPQQGPEFLINCYEIVPEGEEV